nr:transporter substrate-binding domain-containing protein [Xanthomonadales bacterium]
MDFIDARGRHQGLSAELLALLAPRAELRFETRRFASRARARAALLDAQVDLLSGVRIDPEDPQLRFSRSYLRLPAALLGRPGPSAPGTLEDLAGRQVVVVSGHGWDRLLSARVPEVLLREV